MNGMSIPQWIDRCEWRMADASQREYGSCAQRRETVSRLPAVDRCTRYKRSAVIFRLFSVCVCGQNNLIFVY